MGVVGSSWDLNERGQAVWKGGTADGRTRAFLWQAGRVRDLGTVRGLPHSDVVAVNDRGQVIADAYRTGTNEISLAFVWENGKTTDLGTLGGTSSSASAISERGQIVGWATTKNGQTHAVLWTWQPAR